MNCQPGSQPSLIDQLWAGFRIANNNLRDQIKTWAARSELPALRRQITESLDQMPEGKRPFIFAPGMSWNRTLFQRPQHLALALANLGETVFYLDPMVRGSKAEIEQLSLTLFRVVAPPEVLQDVTSAYLYLLPWSYSPQAFLPPANILYDIVDDLSAFSVDPHLVHHHHAVRIKKARLVMVTARRLVDKYKPQRPDLLYLPNAARVEDFARSGLEIPDDLRKFKEKGKPIIGYYGALAEWFDYDLLLDVSARRPDLAFVLLGPTLGDHLRESGLMTRSNAVWLGEKPYHELPAYLHAFDVAIIPFKLNAVTHATSPLKLFEYLAGGKPTVITPMEESLSVPEVLSAQGADAFNAALDRALALSRDTAYCQGLQAAARQHTWEFRAQELLAALAMI